MERLIYIGGAIAVGLAGFYFLVKGIFTSMSNLSQLQTTPQAILVIVKPAVYTTLGLVSLASVAGFFIPDTSWLSFMSCMIPMSIFLGVIHGISDYWKLKRLSTLYSRISSSSAAPTNKDNSTIFRLLGVVALVALLSFIGFLILAIFFYSQVDPLISTWGIGITAILLLVSALLLMYTFARNRGS